VPLSYRAPCDVGGLLAFLAARAIPGIEAVCNGAYHRSLRLPNGGGVVGLAAGEAHVAATLWLEDPRDLDAAQSHCRRLLDLDADPQPILATLAGDPVIGSLVRAAPGRRVPGHVDEVELAVRAVLGQQVSVAGAATLAGRLVADYGEPLASPHAGVTHLFPSAARLAGADPHQLPVPRSRGRALVALAAALAGGQLSLNGDMGPAEVRAQLLALPGIGPWTAGYIAMRVLGDRDVFLSTDLGVRRALRALGCDQSPAGAEALAERWRPYRAYAMLHLWAGAPRRPAPP
jgi:AraC family transcriptional regulator, regulatory protein of adaptative response / DNA-3-methyladenine glycosylase II